jgi:hypothetical protein
MATADDVAEHLAAWCVSPNHHATVKRVCAGNWSLSAHSRPPELQLLTPL